MAEEFKKIKITELSKDLQVKGKDLLKALADNGIEKTASSSLDENEVNVILEYYSALYPVSDIDAIINGKIGFLLPEKKAKADAPAKEAAAEKKAETNEAKIEKTESADKKPAVSASSSATQNKEGVKNTPNTNANKPAAASSSQGQSASASSKFQQRPKQQPVDRFSIPRNQQQQNKKQEKVREVKKERFVSQAPVFDPNREPSEIVTAKRDVRIVDTRTTQIDLSKYDEKLYDYDNSGEVRRNKFSRGGKKPNKAQKKSEPVRAALPELIVLPDELLVSELAKEFRITTAEVVKKLMIMGFRVTLNQVIDFDTAALLADELGVKCEKRKIVTTEEKVIDESADSEEDLQIRPPVVVVMGHVDHGKTSLLDAIRNTSVTKGEAGGITQHIGAYKVTVQGKDITFLDTPGHEAFTSMRARGAMATDIAILVVAADDGIMPQTVEAINHAKAAGVSIVVAINKMDKHTANPEAVKQELTKYDLVPEEWGGDVMCIPVSALTHAGINELLESVLLIAEVSELKANPNRLAKGIVIEAKLDKGRGPVATVLVQNGTLKTGDTIIAGNSVGHVRAMINDLGKNVKEAGPSVPVEILGLEKVPEAGDVFNAVENERMARKLAEERSTKHKEDIFNANSKVSLDDLFSQIKEGIKELNIIVKADVQGSAEAVKQSLEKLSNEEVKVKVIHAAVGGINESDVMLAAASGAIIVGFNVRPDKGALDNSERQNVDIRTYRVIYECIEEIEAAMKGMLAPQYKEVILGHAEVRQTIRVPNVGTIAGSYITDGKVTRNSLIRVLRDSVVIFEDKIDSLKRFKDDAKEVNQGFECGIGLEKFNDIKENDVLEAFIMEEVKA